MTTTCSYAKMRCVSPSNFSSKGAPATKVRHLPPIWTITSASTQQLRKQRMIGVMARSVVVAKASEVAIHSSPNLTCPGPTQTTSGARWWHKPRAMKFQVPVYSLRHITMWWAPHPMRIRRLKMVRVVALTKKKSQSLNQKNRKRKAPASPHLTITTGVVVPQLPVPQYQSLASLTRSLPSLALLKPNSKQLRSPHK